MLALKAICLQRETRIELATHLPNICRLSYWEKAIIRQIDFFALYFTSLHDHHSHLINITL